jgi:hypothetical protein
MPAEPVDKALSREVKRALSDAGLSAPAAARKLGWERKRIYRWIDGDVSPRLEDVELFAAQVGPIHLDIGGNEKKAPPAEADGAVPGWALELTNQLRDEIRVNRETIVAALAREVTRRTLEGNEPLLRQLHAVLARVERRLEE